MVRRLRWVVSRAWGLLAFVALAIGAGILALDHVPRIGGSSVRATAIAADGDSLRVGDRRIRLFGIDAPELDQTCSDQHGRSWACGREAHAKLRALTLSGLPACRFFGTDRYGRTLAECSTLAVGDFGEAMVRAGYALSYRSPRYWLAEADARWNGRGIWRGTFLRPQLWRQGAHAAH
jgi:endonuclease YncB( thermonuclease family)